MNANTPINPVKKTFSAVKSAVLKVNQAHSYAMNKMGGVLAVTGAILAAVNAYLTATIGKAMEWIEDKLAKSIPIVIGFLAHMVGSPEKLALRKVLEKLT